MQNFKNAISLTRNESTMNKDVIKFWGITAINILCFYKTDSIIYIDYLMINKLG